MAFNIRFRVFVGLGLRVCEMERLKFWGTHIRKPEEGRIPLVQIS